MAAIYLCLPGKGVAALALFVAVTCTIAPITASSTNKLVDDISNIYLPLGSEPLSWETFSLTCEIYDLGDFPHRSDLRIRP